VSPIPASQNLAGFQEKIQFEALCRFREPLEVSQHILAKELGISLGSMNFCFKGQVGKGWVKIKNFNHSKNKLRCDYLSTTAGEAMKSKLKAEFLRRKLVEHEALQAEIEASKSEMNSVAGVQQ
jgi:EPS-associated MarR family transcriptional regulator